MSKASRDFEYTEYVQARLAWLGRVAYLLCQDISAADELVQVTITRLYTRWGKAREATNLDAYTRTIMVREFLGDRRSAWSRRVTPVEQYLDAPDIQDDDTRLDVRPAAPIVATCTARRSRTRPAESRRGSCFLHGHTKRHALIRIC